MKDQQFRSVVSLNGGGHRREAPAVSRLKSLARTLRATVALCLGHSTQGPVPTDETASADERILVRLALLVSALLTVTILGALILWW